MTIGIEHVNHYPLIRFDIRFERKFPIRRSLLLRLQYTAVNTNAVSSTSLHCAAAVQFKVITCITDSNC